MSGDRSYDRRGTKRNAIRTEPIDADGICRLCGAHCGATIVHTCTSIRIPGLRPGMSAKPRLR